MHPGDAAADPRHRIVAAANHEMRTTLTAVLGLTQLLRTEAAGPVTDEQDRILGRIEANGRRQLQLVENLLALRDSDTGRLGAGPPPLDPVDARDVVRRAVAGLQELLRGRDVRLAVETGTEVLAVAADQRHLERALANLLDNAVRYTPDGGAVEVRCARRGEDVVVVVADTGPGLAPHELPVVLDRFARGAGAVGGRVPGLGLGLPAAQVLVAAQGGRLELLTGPGTGTRAVVSLPAVRRRAAG